MQYIKLFLPTVLVILLDQAVKFAVVRYMEYGSIGEIHLIGDWCKLHYTLNPGMAFGLELGTSYGKLILTSFRLLATFGFIVYLVWAAADRAHPGFLFCIALVLGGAIGNLIDSVFYGVWLGNAPVDSPTPWLHGQVVDMLYLDVWQGIMPEWIPFFGGEWYSFWPIFNVADASIFCGIASILIFQSKFFPKTAE
jgi:signal peptidase II